jgi:hypothetical protein
MYRNATMKASVQLITMLKKKKRKKEQYLGARHSGS